MKNIITGLGLIVLAGYLLFAGSLNIPQLGMSIWLLLCVAGFGLATIHNLWRKKWNSSYIYGVITFILLNTHFNWLKVSKGTIIFAAILIGIGLQFIFQPKRSVVIINDYQGKKKKQYRHKNNNVAVVFGSDVRYVNGDIIEIGAEMVFGSATFYFDNAKLPLGEATFSGDAVFSSIKLYVPNDWAVQFVGAQVFSSIKLEPNDLLVTKKLYVQGDFVFSSLEIIYID